MQNEIVVADNVSAVLPAFVGDNHDFLASEDFFRTDFAARDVRIK